LAAIGYPFLAGRFSTMDDLGNLALPLGDFYARQLARGEPLDWNPNLYCGFYLSGSGGTYHPLKMLIYRLFPLPAAFGLELWIGYPLMLAGTWLWLRRRLGRADAAMLGSLGFTFGSFNLLHFIHPAIVLTAAHIPWLLWAIDGLLTTPVSARGQSPVSQWPPTVFAAILALVTGSQILLGFPQVVWFSLISEAAYAILLELMGLSGNGSVGNALRGVPRTGNGVVSRTAERHGGRSLQAEPTSRPSPSRRFLRPAWLRLLGAKLLGLMLGAMQILPMADMLAQSTRGSAAPQFFNLFSLDPRNLLQLVAPYLTTRRVFGHSTHEFGLYAGAVPLALACWALADRRRWGSLRGLAWSAAGFGLGALVLSLGEYGPLYRFQRYLPLVGQFRCPCRYILLFQLSLGVLASVGALLLITRCQQGEKASWRRLSLLGIPILASLVAAAWGLAMRGTWPVAPTLAVLTGPALIGLAVLLVIAAVRGRRAAIFGLILLATADQGYYGLSYAVYGHRQTWRQYLASISPLPPTGAKNGTTAATVDARRPGVAAGANSEPSRVNSESAPVSPGGYAGWKSCRLAVNLNPVKESGYWPGPCNRLTLLGWKLADGYVGGLEPVRRLDLHEPAALRVAGVRWVLRGPAADRIEGLVVRDSRWLEVPRPLAYVRLVTQSRQTSDPARDIRRIDIETTALADEPLELPAGPAGRILDVAQRPGRVEARVDCPARQLLVVAESYHPGWLARVDGRPQTVHRVNGDFLGCVVGPGVRQVVFEFRPRSLFTGRVIAFCGLCLVMLSLAAPLVSRSRRRGRESHSPSGRGQG
jgi:hypothetical protein